jgi:spore germination protein KB
MVTVMEKTVISTRQSICTIILFILGSSIILGIGKEANRDIWISILLGIIIGLFIVIVYSRILSRFPNKNLFDILLIIYGNYIGRLFCLIYIFYSFYLAALVLVNYSMFISIIGLEFTPQIVVSFVFIILVINGVKKGIEVLGRWAEFFTRFLYPIIIIIVISMLTMVNVNNLSPILSDGFMPVMDGAITLITFPFAELIIFTMIFKSKTVIKNNVYKVFILGLIFGGIIILITTTSAYLCLGPFAYNSSYFPIYSAVSRINIKDIFQRVEIVLAVSFILGGFLKISLCILGCCNGIVSFMNLKDYKFLVTPIGLIVLVASLTTYRSIIEMIEGINSFKYIAIFVQIILPLTLLITIEIKFKIEKSKNKLYRNGDVNEGSNN